MSLKQKYLAFRNSEIVQHIAILFLTSFGGGAIYVLSTTCDINPLTPIESLTCVLEHVKSYAWEYQFWDTAFGAALGGSVVPHIKLFINKYLTYITPPKIENK